MMGRKPVAKMQSNGMKTVVITGASSGIGFATAKLLAKSGYQVYGLCRRNHVPQSVRWMACDITDRESIKKVIETILEETGRIDIWVNNAGMGIAGALEYEKEADVRKQFEVNLFGSIWCTQEVFQIMRKQKGGRILFVSSLASVFPIPFQTLYSASKSAVNTISDAVGMEGRPFGIETCTILLNDVKTEFTDARIIDDLGNDTAYGGRILTSIQKMEQSERHGMTPEKVAAQIVKLLKRPKLPPHKIIGISNEFLGVLNRILPARCIIGLLYKLYGGL